MKRYIIFETDDQMHSVFTYIHNGSAVCCKPVIGKEWGVLMVEAQYPGRVLMSDEEMAEFLRENRLRRVETDAVFSDGAPVASYEQFN